MTAPRVVVPFHNSDRISTGKLPEAASAKASETMKATFCFSNRIPSRIANAPSASVLMRETLSSLADVAFPLLKTVAKRS